MYLEILKGICNNSKYTKWYINIVTKSLIREKEQDSFYEKHHIVPESFFISRSRKGSFGDIDGNSEDKKNFVYLTPREHFFVHLFLPKMLLDEIHIEKAKYAITIMVNCNNGKVRLNSKLYERARKLASENNISKKEKQCIYCGEIRKLAHEYSCPKNPNRILAKPNVEALKNNRVICVHCGESTHPSHPMWCKLNPHRKIKDQFGDKNVSKTEKQCKYCGEIKKLAHEAKCKLNPNRNISFSGNKNPKAKIYVLSSPTGVIEVCGGIENFCKENGFTLHRLKNNMIEGWSIIEKRLANFQK